MTLSLTHCLSHSETPTTLPRGRRRLKEVSRQNTLNSYALNLHLVRGSVVEVNALCPSAFPMGISETLRQIEKEVFKKQP